MFNSYLKIALRILFRNKLYSLVNILGLAIGVSTCLVIYLLVSFELSFENFHPDRERIYRITSGFKNQDGKSFFNAGLSAPMPESILQEIPGIEYLTACHVWDSKVTVPNDKNDTKNLPKTWKSNNAEILICQPQYFNIFNYEWLEGNQKTALQTPNEVILTKNEAEKYFGKIPLQQVLGKQLYFNDSLVTTVTGIVKELPDNSDFKFKVFISFKSIEAKNWRKEFQLDEWTNTNSSSMAFVKLSQNTTAGNINAKFPTFLKKHLDQKDEWNIGRTLSLQALSDIHFNAEFGDNFSRQVHLPTLYALLGIAVFLLLIAAINFVNLATAQSITRVKEIGVRKVLGSNRKSLIIQFLCETLIITTLAVLLSVLFVEPILWIFEDFVPKELHFNILDPNTIAFLILITIVTCVLSGLYPAWIISSYQPVSSLKNQVVNGQSSTAFLRKALITFQFTASQVFILGTIIVATQSRFMLNKDLGFKKDAIINFYSDWHDTESNKKNVLIQKLKQIPEVEMVSLGDKPAKNGYSTNRVTYRNGKKEVKLDVHRRSVDANYIPMYGLKIVAGRNLTTSDTAKEFVINESYAKALGFNNPEQAIGQFLIYSGGKGDINLPIVGVVADFHLQPLHKAIQPLYMMSENKYETAFNVKVRSKGQSSTDFKAVLAKIQKAYKEVYPNSYEEFSPTFFDESIAKFYEKEERFAKILNTATGIAILISCMGLFGLVAFTTQQRTKEIGIRKVLGASVSQIVKLLSKDFLKLVILGIVIASPIAYWAMNKWLQDFAYRVDISWWIFALAAIASIIIALISVSYQSIKAALMNPVKSLRAE
ncbi:FtsX-like permease family protein [Arcicella aquatica]|uniref:FtsX-like permease family protein n=1 Tax=Arcicella aquatica TaxID=217141 RepID=A0ABU5QIU3_9BACT|nr:FtsX-like permease family protein [Arcicella aquatica]MEA5256972.1 FtsX-like permease family protein [Arcicella aquatica]